METTLRTQAVLLIHARLNDLEHEIKDTRENITELKRKVRDNPYDEIMAQKLASEIRLYDVLISERTESMQQLKSM